MDLLGTAQLDLNAPIRPRVTDSPVPLTAVQRRIWELLTRQGKSLSPRMCVSAVRVLGPLDVGHLQRSIEALIHRHESLRTRLIVVEGTPRQHIDAPADYRLNLVDLSKEPDRHTEVKALVHQFLDQQIDLLAGPLFEAGLWKLSDQEHVLVLLIDHLVSDGVSNGILTRELWTLYDQAVRDQPFSLPPLTVQFADYAVWHQQTHHAWMQRHESYWRERLKGVQLLEVPSDAELSERGAGASQLVHIPFGRALSDRLRDAARREGVILPLVVLTAYVTVMSHWCEQQDVLLQFVSHGRYGRPELENVVGYISQFLHLRIEIHRALTFRDLLNQVQQEFSAATEHQDFDRVPDFVSLDPGELNFQWRSRSWARNARDACPLIGGHVRTEPFIVRLPVWPWKFWSVFYDTPTGIGVTVNYRPDCLAASTIQRFGRQLRWVGDALATRPLERVSVESVAAQDPTV